MRLGKLLRVALLILRFSAAHRRGPPQGDNPWWNPRTQRFAARACAALSINVQAETEDKDFDDLAADGPLLVCSNHIGYLDIPILLSVLPLPIVASARVFRSGLTHRWLRVHDVIIADRRDPSVRPHTVEAIRSRLAAGASVLIFPEGDTSDGQQLRIFLKGGFEAAIAADARILPVAIKLQHINGRADPPAEERDRFHWYRDLATGTKVSVLSHLIGLAGLQSVGIRLIVGAPIEAASHTPAVLAGQARERIRELLGLEET